MTLPDVRILFHREWHWIIIVAAWTALAYWDLGQPVMAYVLISFFLGVTPRQLTEEPARLDSGERALLRRAVRHYGRAMMSEDVARLERKVDLLR